MRRKFSSSRPMVRSLRKKCSFLTHSPTKFLRDKKVGEKIAETSMKKAGKRLKATACLRLFSPKGGIYVRYSASKCSASCFFFVNFSNVLNSNAKRLSFCCYFVISYYFLFAKFLRTRRNIGRNSLKTPRVSSLTAGKFFKLPN